MQRILVAIKKILSAAREAVLTLLVRHQEEVPRPIGSAAGGSGDATDHSPGTQDQGPRRVRVITREGYRVQLDLSHQVLHLSLPRDISSKTWGETESRAEVAVVPTLADVVAADRFVSASMLAQKAKQFDDGLYAAVELAAQRGLGLFPGKESLLKSVASTVSSQALGQAVVTLLAGTELGKPVASRSDAPHAVQEAIHEFLQDEVRSKPLAFYAWTEELSAIFRQDRMLQTELRDAPGTAAIARSLHGDGKARATYEAYLSLVSRLTGPLADPDLRPQLRALDRNEPGVMSEGIRFFPPSRSHETELVKSLYGDRPIPEGFSLIDEMTRQIQKGTLRLEPTTDSGWYAYQTWALEPLVIPGKMPEAAHLSLDHSYLQQLLELFKGILALTRETHIKQLQQLQPGCAGPGPEVIITISPELSVEPLATYYVRRAQSYRFIRTVLEETFGAPALAQVCRLTAAGPVQADLAEELHRMESLFYGAYLTVCQELGMAPTGAPQLGFPEGSAEDATAFSRWRAGLADDPDLGQDARMMVPVFHDVERRKTKVWAFLGWASKPVDVAFEQKPTATILDAAGKPVKEGAPDAPRLEFNEVRYSLAYPVTAEVYVTKILDRAEFRAHCDRHRTRAAILANLE